MRCGNFSLNLASALGKTLPQLGGAALTLGIRAEDLQPAETPKQSWISGEVEIVEDLGSDRFVHLKCAGIELIARTGRESMLCPGDTAGFDVAPGRLHMFTDGARIEP